MEKTWGGPPAVVSNLIRELNEYKCELDLWSTYSHANDNIYMDNYPKHKTFLRSKFHKYWKGYSIELKDMVKSDLHNYDLVHIHEMWNYPLYIVANEAILKDIPYVLTIHGSLNSRAREFKYIRKLLYSIFLQNKIVEKAAMLHALTENEKQQIMIYKNTDKIKVIPNGIKFPPSQIKNYKNIIIDKYPFVKQKNILLYCGRIHNIKGLENLIDAFMALGDTMGNTVLFIVGPDDNKHAKYLQNKSFFSTNIIFTGMQTGHLKTALFQAADIFIMPSFSEGFSMSILEALSYGIPVIATRQCNFDEIEEKQAGILIQPSIKDIQHALNILLKDSTLRRKMSLNAKDLISQKYSWENIASQIWKLYQKIIYN